MKPVEFDLNGRTLHLLLNANALFACYDRFGSKDDLLEKIVGTNGESWENTVWVLVKLAQQGELWRRYCGEDPIPMLTEAEAQRIMMPLDAVRARAAIRKAYALGFEREEIGEEEKVDLFLSEWQKKTEPASRAQNGLALPRSFWGFLSGKL